MARRYISRYTEGKREMALVGTRPRSPKMSFQNGSLRSLLFQIPKILQQPPLPTTARSKSDAYLSIMVMVHGDFTGMMDTRSGEISKTRSHMFVFTIPLTIQKYISPT